MSHTFKRSVVSSTMILLLLGGVAALAEYAPRQKSGPGRSVLRAIRTLDEREPNREDLERQTRGYYEALLDAGSEQGSWLDLRRLLGGAPEPAEAPAHRLNKHKVTLKNFLQFELPPNLNATDPDPRFSVVTNRFGMADRDYALEKPAATHRIAVLGDSIAFGHGTPPGTSFPAVLEDRLNGRLARGPVEHVEILNFGISGYRATQQLEVAREKASRFQPDAFLVTITPLSLVERWGHHIVELVQQGIDLKHEYLRQVVADAAIAPGDTPETMHAKLAKFKLPTLRWVLSELKAFADRSHASMVVVLIPSVHGTDIIDEHFDGVHDMLSGVDAPVIDLLDSFADVELSSVRVGDGDNHPNQEGHRLLTEAILRQVETNAQVRNALLGDTVLIGAPGR